MRVLLLCILFMIVFSPASSQEAPVKKGLEITVHWGLIHRGAGHSLKRQMENAGFNDKLVSHGFFQFSDPKNPKRTESSAQISFSVPVVTDYRVKGLFNYRETLVHGSTVNMDLLQVTASCNTMAVLGLKEITLKQTGFLSDVAKEVRFGGGPAFFLADTQLQYGETSVSHTKSNKPGFALETGIRFFSGRRFILDSQLQYFYAGKADAGRHVVTNEHLENTNREQRVVDFRKISLSSLQLSFGFGFRFGKS